MTRLAITGHRGLTPDTLTAIDAAIRDIITARLNPLPHKPRADRLRRPDHPVDSREHRRRQRAEGFTSEETPGHHSDPGALDLHGVSCLADGPDSLFAQAILDHGGHLTAVVPARTYRESLPVTHHPTYDHLVAAAAEVVELDRDKSDSDAHQAGSLRMLDSADELLAVWDGKPARGYGGTADVVGAARARGMRVTVIWPPGTQRP
ncbi:hypothetical protein JK358_16135 [Nocardia sp. 2]|uniref:Uncharacterized protein n=1 Tax=Nocardia acididurans TaxID=2802282 RepID=A0ABS1M5L5_9NOCA|nr:hypothetical protein [Nocardia acididurans]MBL1075927.1 hypothetical protein [Nocardia acididurans]